MQPTDRRADTCSYRYERAHLKILLFYSPASEKNVSEAKDEKKSEGIQLKSKHNGLKLYEIDALLS